MNKEYPKWEEVFTNELTLQALFEKLIDVEYSLKDEILILERKVEELEWELKDKINQLENKIYYD